MSKQTYNEAGIKFEHRGAGKWEFTLPTVVAYTFLSKSPEGKTGAEKIARILAGSVKRSGGVDGMARKMIRRLLNPEPQSNPIVY